MFSICRRTPSNVIDIDLALFDKRQRHQDWQIRQWRPVLFTDESRFTLRTCDRHDRVCRHIGERSAACNILQHDRFRSGSVMVWLGISLEGRTAPRSPDLNSIEHIWDIMFRSIHQRHFAPQTVQELADAVVQVWKEIPQETIRHLIRSMPRRFREVIQARGGHTHY
uniref:Tc1-like transposase DDE domain-containing protein n=1 Tax=Anabas testudineus TaxID=64144 RepID=A0AAQ6IQJ3_ANATE